ncbi:MAG: hypothetical protein JJU08_13830 [Rhodobacteraceae bacterium]|nr:hypothetical protein [Paracoccaceae bacterium]
MSDADIAYKKAQIEIGRLKEAGKGILRLEGEAFRALDRLPPELAELTGLRVIRLCGTQVSDLEPLQGLTGLLKLHFDHTQVSSLASLQGLTSLQTLVASNTQVSDLRPIAQLESLAATSDIMGLSFHSTPATQRDAHLAAMAEIEGPRGRARQTLDYLRSLPPWPAPYTPDDSSPQPIGGEPETTKVKAAKAHIENLLNNPMLTRLSAQQFAGQIRTALHGINDLPEALLTMLEFADALEMIAPATERVTAPLGRAKLELRIAHLEATLERLHEQLEDKTKALEAAKVLAGNGAFGRNFTEEAGKQTAKLVFLIPKAVMWVGIYHAATHLLGAGNPVLQAFSSFMSNGAK